MMTPLLLTDHESGTKDLFTYGDSGFVRASRYEDEDDQDESYTELYDNSGETVGSVKETPGEILRMLTSPNPSALSGLNLNNESATPGTPAGEPSLTEQFNSRLGGN